MPMDYRRSKSSSAAEMLWNSGRSTPLSDSVGIRPTSAALLRSTRSASSLDKLYVQTGEDSTNIRPSSAGSTIGRSKLASTASLRIPSEENYWSRNIEKDNALLGTTEEIFSWKRPDSAMLRRKINALQFANVADKLVVADDIVQGNDGLQLEEPEIDIVQVMAFIRQRAVNSQIFLADFFRNFDTHRKGYICPENFFRAISDMGCFKDMLLAEQELVLNTFSEPRPLNFKRHVFNYAAFAEILQPCNDSRIHMTGKYLKLRESVGCFQPDMSLDSPYAIKPLTAKGEARVGLIKKKLQHKIISTRLSVRELLGDFDPHLNTTTVGHMKQQYKHTQFLCNVPGCISRSQYIRGMMRLAGDLELSAQDIDLLYLKYERNGAFNYYAFCRDIDSPVDLVSSPSKLLPVSPTRASRSPTRSLDSSPMTAAHRARYFGDLNADDVASSTSPAGSTSPGD